MAKPTKKELAEYGLVLKRQLRTLTGDISSMREEALRASEQDNSVDHLADQGTDNADQAFTWLQNAAKAGYKNTSHMASDSALDSIRDDPRYAEIIALMEG